MAQAKHVPQADAPSPLLTKMRQTFLLCYTIFYGGQAWLQWHLAARSPTSGDHLSVIVHAVVIAGNALMATWGLYNMAFLRNPHSRLYLFRWMST